MNKAFRLPAQNIVNIALATATVIVGLSIVLVGARRHRRRLSCSSCWHSLLGVIVTLPIGGADMPVVISLFNAFHGTLCRGLRGRGFVLGIPALGSSPVLSLALPVPSLTQLMAKAMNRPITNILFTPISGEAQGGAAVEGSMKELSGLDAASSCRFAQKVIIVPGYGMAVAGAQHKVWEMAKLLEEAGVEVKFAIHPVAGRMPGHMNVLLAEAGVPYEQIFDLEEINAEFPLADVALVDCANDVDQSRGAHRQVEPDLWHADSRCGQGAKCHRHQAW